MAVEIPERHLIADRANNRAAPDAAKIRRCDFDDDAVVWLRHHNANRGAQEKSGVEQVSPLTPKAREILEQIKDESKTGAMIPNLQGLVFTLSDGTPITRGLIHSQVKKGD